MRKEILKVAGIYLLIGIFFLGKAFLKEYISGDFSAFWIPNYRFVLESIKSGILPFWQPYSFLGVPGIFHPGYAFFYPVLWLIFLLNLILNPSIQINFLGKSLELYQYLHLLIGAIGIYYLVRKRVNLSQIASFSAGFIYTFSLFSISSIGDAQSLQGRMYLPWIIFFLLNFIQNTSFKNFLLLVLINFILLSLGYPHYVIYFFYAQLGLALFYGIKPFLKTGFALLNSVLLSGFFLLPQLSIFIQASRFSDAASNPNFHTQFAPIGTFIINMLIPQGIYSGSVLFWGTIPFIFLIIGLFSLKNSKLNNWLVAIFLLSMILSLGGYLNVPQILGGFPFFIDKLRTHGQILVLSFFAGTIFISYGVEKAINGLKGNKTYLSLWLFYFLLIISMLLLPFISKNYLVEQKELLINLGRMLILFGSGLVICQLASLQKNKTLIIIALLITLFEFYFYYSRIEYLKIGIDYQKYFARNSLIPEIPNKDNLFRYIFSENQFAYNTAYLKVFQYLGYDPTPYGGVYNLARFGDPKGLEIANVKYAVSAQYLANSENPKLIKTINPADYPDETFVSSMLGYSGWTPKSKNIHYIYQYQNYLPRFFIPKKVKKCSNEDCWKEENPPDLVFVKDVDINLKNPVAKVVSIKIDSYSPNEIKLTANTPLDTFIASSETFDKGWRLKINNKKSDIYNVMNGFRGFILPEGRSNVKLYFIPHNLILGIALTVIGLITMYLIFRNKKMLKL
ncbi:hypothetical protein A3C98_02655 [Candidatus Roizmanbacteria bacterium RIFCSPHIGHO2_02_FULL_37_15]|uniref:Membrane protein 6-pyruvoyl-tetrahydropterin synthase-related domain-containing protein n=1 Tax=Candidatus Roizmanbacteria bacterium RIFCSPLOWO2_01_FULL_37_16 TaxID=1802058 RepID=A0A1F7ILS4_9BACT|nr:MAG: hypothetical protein A3C98_02655 [Candidatus Roizmanbacteria bacterium RIFCSPHIGHO2_02_FULL_37_15]OGK31851.1 MAG: hypothetical protein A3F57_01870 [Candidatus Roizmanbacteria bacterium RIFCSPHIGHO2_12_FULL_36_11]OGK44344.1 MAG: hypothetical protein A3B40_01830 [Candidatus Roizmanbacteria bacterium RIFCSPLOWO2_01_FULL_37_16]